jgi:ApaG protein
MRAWQGASMRGNAAPPQADCEGDLRILHWKKEHGGVSVPAMFCEFKELTGLTVTVDKVVYMPHLEAPPERPYPFAYYITIHNESENTVTIKGRKWVVTDDEGNCLVVEGDGVVGKFPRLEPGDEFSYNSYHTIGHDSVVEGSFFGTSEEGTPVLTRIPKFKLNLSDCF